MSEVSISIRNVVLCREFHTKTTLPHNNYSVWRTAIYVIFTARRYASAVYAVTVFVYPSVYHKWEFYQDG